MAVRGLLLLLLAILFQIVLPSVASDVDPRTAKLLKMQQKHKDKVIHLDGKTFSKFAASGDTRPYSLVIFFDAEELHKHAELNLKHLRREFGLVATAFHKTHKDSNTSEKLFFCDIEFASARDVFGRFGVNSLPHYRFFKAGRGDTQEEIKLDKRDAEAVAQWVEAKTGLSMGAIVRPPPISQTQMIFILVTLVTVGPLVAWKLLTTKTPLHSPILWCWVGLVVYFFSVSGGMFNIIRNMPFSIPDREKKGYLQFFLRGSGQQLGAEGFIVGGMYTLVGLLVAFSTHVVGWIESRSAQRLVMVLTLTSGVLALQFVLGLNRWKTHYQIRTYWPW